MTYECLLHFTGLYSVEFPDFSIYVLLEDNERSGREITALVIPLAFWMIHLFQCQQYTTNVLKSDGFLFACLIPIISSADRQKKHSFCNLIVYPVGDLKQKEAKRYKYRALKIIFTNVAIRFKNSTWTAVSSRKYPHEYSLMRDIQLSVVGRFYRWDVFNSSTWNRLIRTADCNLRNQINRSSYSICFSDSGLETIKSVQRPDLQGVICFVKPWRPLISKTSVLSAAGRRTARQIWNCPWRNVKRGPDWNTGAIPRRQSSVSLAHSFAFIKIYRADPGTRSTCNNRGPNSRYWTAGPPPPAAASALGGGRHTRHPPSLAAQVSITRSP